MPIVRQVYSNASSATITTTSSASFVNAHSLDFVPSKNNANVAIFWSAMMYGGSISYDSYCQIRLGSNGNSVLQQTNLEPKDTTDRHLISGMCLVEGLSNLSVASINMAVLSEISGVSATLSNMSLTAIELGDNDYWDNRWSFTGSLSTSYNTYASVTVPEGRWAFIASAGPYDADNSTVAYNRIMQRCRLGSSTYGAVSEIRGRDANNIDYYYYVMTANTIGQGSQTFAYQAGDDSSSLGQVGYINVLALNLDDWPSSFSNHNETKTSLASTSATDCLTTNFSLAKGQDVFISASFATVYGSTSYSALHRFMLDGVSLKGTGYFEPPSSTSTFSNGGSQAWGGYNGVKTLGSGSHTLSTQHWSEIGTVSVGTARRNHLILAPSGSLNVWVRDGGTWKQSDSVHVRSSGTWQEADTLSVKSAGIWEETPITGQGFVGSHVNSVSDETSNPSSPPPPPPPPPTPPNPPSCVSFGTLVTMLDGTKKPVQDIVIGDVIYSRDGIAGTVKDIDKVPLGTYRRMMKLYHEDMSYLRITDDHDLWTRIDDVETWATYNYNWWLYENECYPEDGIIAVPIMPMKPHVHATEYGWTVTKPDYELSQDPNEIVYGLQLDQGDGFYADGFYVMAMPYVG